MALALITYRARQAFDDRLDAKTVDAPSPYAGIDMLVAAVWMPRTWGHAAAVGTDLFFRTTVGAGLLTNDSIG
jgi:hypothetical protein